jgi:glycogen operon protein
LRDLVSYNEKHNEANGENNQDGENHNRSWNCGTEGPTKDPSVLRLRRRQQRNFLVTLLLSQGVPMLLHGDEMGRTQRGNNNAYCQDNELSWIDWDLVKTNADMVEFTSRLTKLRDEHPVFRRRRFFTGARGSDELHDVAWFDTDGELMDDEDWENGYARTLAMFLNGEAITSPGLQGQQVLDDSFLLLFNAHEAALPFIMPAAEWGASWEVELDTADEPSKKKGARHPVPRAAVRAGESMSVEGRSAMLLRRLS